MTRKRDYIGEIRDRRSRAGEPIAVIDLFDRLHDLLDALDNTTAISAELMRYFPVAMAACLETYTRVMVQELVDSGPPFSDGIAAFKDLTIELEMMKAIQGRRITLGALLGHLARVSRPADMNRWLEPLLGRNIFDIVKSAAGDNDGQLIDGVESLFRLRHIYAHEFPALRATEVESIRGSVRAAVSFLTILNRGIFEIAFTQHAMNRHTADQFVSLDRELEELVESLASRLSEPHARRLHEAQNAWRASRDTTSNLMADLEAEDGSMHPMAHNRFAAELTRRRIEELRNFEQFRW